MGAGKAIQGSRQARTGGAAPATHSRHGGQVRAVRPGFRTTNHVGPRDRSAAACAEVWVRLDTAWFYPVCEVSGLRPRLVDYDVLVLALRRVHVNHGSTWGKNVTPRENAQHII